MVSLVWAIYVTVLVAELAGDKTLYTLGALATRFRFAPLLAGAALAFMIKMLAAVLLGRVIAELPPVVVSIISAVTFFAMAIMMWFRRPSVAAADAPPTRWPRATLISFAAIFFPEWGDPGQLAAAVFVARGAAPGVVWVAAVLAMITKAALAIGLGIGLRRFVSQRVVQRATVALCLVMGCLAAFQIEI